MNTYHVDVEHNHFWRYTVQAENEDEAEELILDDPETYEPENVDHLYSSNVIEGSAVSIRKVEEACQNTM